MKTGLIAVRERIVQRWTVQRLLYTFIGLVLVVQAWQDSQWIWMIFGAYYCSMGVFAFGCAGGSCSIPLATERSEKETTFINVLPS